MNLGQKIKDLLIRKLFTQEQLKILETQAEIKRLLNARKKEIDDAIKSSKKERLISPQGTEFLMECLEQSDYQKLVLSLSNESLDFLLNRLLCYWNIDEKRFIESVEPDIWVEKICQNKGIFWTIYLSDELPRILNTAESALCIENFEKLDMERCCLAFSLMNEEQINRVFEGVEDFESYIIPVLNSVEKFHQGLKLDIIFEKISSMAPQIIAKIISTESTDTGVVKKIVSSVHSDKIFEVCLEIPNDSLYIVLEQSDFSFMTEEPNDCVFSFVYDLLPNEKQEDFLQKMEQYGLLCCFGPENAANYYRLLDKEDQKEFSKKIFYQSINKNEENQELFSEKEFYHQYISDEENQELFSEKILCQEIGNFDIFCQSLTEEEQFEVYKAILEDENEEWQNLLKEYLLEKEKNSVEDEILKMIP